MLVAVFRNRMLVPLASLAQIETTPSHADGVPPMLEEDLRAAGCKLIHEAALLLTQQQAAAATAQILFQRFWYAASMRDFSVAEVAMGSLYLASKLAECPVRIRDLLNVFHVLLHRAGVRMGGKGGAKEKEKEKEKEGVVGNMDKWAPMGYFASTFYDLKDALVVAEMQILKRLGFNTHVVLPYNTLVNYLRVLGLTTRPEACSKAWGYLNDSLQTPVYALYAVPTIVSAAILLTARTLPVPLPEGWWVLFDCEWADVWAVCGTIMRLYRVREPDEKERWKGLLRKEGVRRYLEGK
ncbi:cyclin-like protein [Athelia psychrophila]|uniref:Cyclin-like protein n=1 Tax=Athelia psychrophila TaxID=1759441 RepID=A0A166M3M1_9AGAM|nr:cyclin-like protein [Fibularhizoctonia sp. CBS 109695]